MGLESDPGQIIHLEECSVTTTGATPEVWVERRGLWLQKSDMEKPGFESTSAFLVPRQTLIFG